mgnify:CR=1 FL=1
MCRASLCCRNISNSKISQLRVSQISTRIETNKNHKTLNEENLKWRTEILDSCCNRPHEITGIVFVKLDNLDATTLGTSLIWSLVYEPAGIISSSFPCSIS